MPTGDRYVAFVDLLGFSDYVQKSWDEAMANYNWFIQLTETIQKDSAERHTREGKQTTPLPELVVASDSVMVVGENLSRVLEMVQMVQTAALIGNSLLVRGCVAFGKHFHESVPNRYSIVSVALARAVAGEKLAHHPRVILDRESGVEEQGRDSMRLGSPMVLPCDDGLMMVQPFILQGQYNLDYYEGQLLPLVAQYKGTRHAPKWDWMYSMVRRVEQHLDELADAGDDEAYQRWRDDQAMESD